MVPANSEPVGPGPSTQDYGAKEDVEVFSRRFFRIFL